MPGPTVTADNRRYFGNPVYDYTIWQGIEDGYLALMEIRKRDISLNQYEENEAVTGVQQTDLENLPIHSPTTGAAIGIEEIRSRYEASSFEAQLMIPGYGPTLGGWECDGLPPQRPWSCAGARGHGNHESAVATNRGQPDPCR